MTNDKTPVPHWYTYPPKTSYRDADSFAYEELELLNYITANAYVHIPFCNMKCSFCSLFTSAGYNAGTAKAYVTTVASEIEQTLHFNPNLKFLNIYFGGGTPSILDDELVCSVVKPFNETISPDGQSRAVEFSPDVVSDASVSIWRKHGFNRASLGIQSFDNKRLLLMRRLHDEIISVRAINLLNGAGFSSTNVDLIFGGYGQTGEDWARDLEKVVSSGADSCTFHPMSVLEKTNFERKLNAGEYVGNILDLHAQAVEFFASAGWRRTSAISFSRTGTANPFEVAEAFGTPTIGFGAGARTYLKNAHISTLPAENRLPFTSVLSAYMNAVKAGRKPALSVVALNDEELARRMLILQLHHGRILKATLNQLTEATKDDAVVKKIENLISEGCAIDTGSAIELSNKVAPDVAGLCMEVSSAAVRDALFKRSIGRNPVIYNEDHH